MLVWGSAAAPAATQVSPGQTRPKLILSLVIDQFRADSLMRHRARFLPARGTNGEVGGFEYLLREGAYYPYAEYEYLQNMTGPGHATVLTGSYPYQNGVPLNFWFDPKTLQYQYCAEDTAFKTVGASPKSTHVGTSPHNLRGTTVGDELKGAGYPSQVISIALKDRSAIFMGGHRADLALWWDGEVNHWVSSTFYLPDGKLPAFVEKLNDEIKRRWEGKSTTWELPPAASTGHSLKDPMALMEHGNASNLGGITFPHTVAFDSRGFLATPEGVSLTVEATLKALDHYQLGRGKGTDLLAVSISSHDYLSHAFGPNSREMEEMTLREDKALSQLFNALQKKVPGGLDQVVITLTADHGGPANPDWLKANRVDAGRINEKQLQETLNKRLNDRFGKPSEGEWIPVARDFNFFFNHPAIQKKKLDLAAFEAIGVEVLSAEPGAAQVIKRTDLQAKRWPAGRFGRVTELTFFDGRTGDLNILPKPFYQLNDDTVNHLTNYAYDRTVPLILAGFGIRKGVYAQTVKVVDLAPTLTFISGTMPPALSEGRVLHEALNVSGQVSGNR